MRIFITGGTGLVGSSLIKVLSKQGHSISVLTRSVAKAARKLGKGVEFCSSLNGRESLDEYDAVINLAGESIAGKRWTKGQKDRLCNSRWDITRKLSTLIKSGTNPPSIYISGSAIGYYGAQSDNVLTEESFPHDEFISRLCRQWEDYALEAKSDKTRVCILRTGIVLSGNGGMLPKMALPFKAGLGSVLGTGKQYISWIHIKDMVDGIVFLLENSKSEGIFNLISPDPITNREFSRSLAKALDRPCLFRIPSSLIRFVLGELSTLVLDGQRAMSKRLTNEGFQFTYEDVDDALGNIYHQKGSESY